MTLEQKLDNLAKYCHNLSLDLYRLEAKIAKLEQEVAAPCPNPTTAPTTG